MDGQADEQSDRQTDVKHTSISVFRLEIARVLFWTDLWSACSSARFSLSSSCACFAWGNDDNYHTHWPHPIASRPFGSIKVLRSYIHSPMCDVANESRNLSQSTAAVCLVLKVLHFILHFDDLHKHVSMRVCETHFCSDTRVCTHAGTCTHMCALKSRAYTHTCMLIHALTVRAHKHIHKRTEYKTHMYVLRCRHQWASRLSMRGGPHLCESTSYFIGYRPC